MPGSRSGEVARSANSTALLTNLAFFIAPKGMATAQEGVPSRAKVKGIQRSRSKAKKRRLRSCEEGRKRTMDLKVSPAANHSGFEQS